MGFQNILPWNMAPWQIEDFKMKELEKIAETGRSLWPSPVFSPKIGHKTLLQKVPSLFLRERSILISEGKGTLRRMPSKPDLPNSPVYYTCLILFILLYFSRTVHFSSNLAEKCSGLFLRSSFPMKAPVSYKYYINFYAFLLLIYQFNVQTQPGTKQGGGNIFLPLYLIMTKMLASTSAVLFFIRRLLSQETFTHWLHYQSSLLPGLNFSNWELVILFVFFVCLFYFCVLCHFSNWLDLVGREGAWNQFCCLLRILLKSQLKQMAKIFLCGASTS